MNNKSNRTPIEEYAISKAKEYRINAGYSQSELAFKMDLSSGFIGKIESSKFKSKYNLNHINKLSEIFNISPKEFLPENYFKEEIIL